MIAPIIKDLKKIVEEELVRANNENPPFHSAHEGWAVLHEEVREAEKEMEAVKLHDELIMDAIFADLKYDGDRERLEKRAMMLAAEAIQVAAMCEKMKGLNRSNLVKETVRTERQSVMRLVRSIDSTKRRMRFTERN